MPTALHQAGRTPNENEALDALPTQGRVLTKAARIYDAVQPIVTLGQEARLNRWVAASLQPAPGARILDVGCGTGLLTQAIAEKHSSCEVIGIDASRPMIEVAHRKRAGGRISYRQAVAEDLPFGDGDFDIVTSALFFHHVNRVCKSQALSEARRVLKPGGQLVVADIERPYTALGWLMAVAGWLVLLQPEIKENIDGIMTNLIEGAGFKDIARTKRFSGYIAVLSAHKGLNLG